MEEKLFEDLLGLEAPWYVVNKELLKDERKMDIYIDFKKGAKFKCPVCGKLCPAYDTVQKTWRHLNLFQYKTFIHARIPRIDCSEHKKKQIEIPWARNLSGFSLYMESSIMTFAKKMTIKEAADILGETDKRIWRVIENYVEKAISKQEFSAVKQIGIDETAIRKGHKYISLFVDLEKKKVIHICEGKGAEVVNTFSIKIKKHKGLPENITDVSCDMSPAFIKGIQEHLPNASITFDRFHVMKLMNEALDKVRKSERVSNEELKNTRYIWLKNPEHLTDEQKVILKNIERLNIKTARAYKIKLAFQNIFKQDNDNAVESLKAWYSWAIRSRLEPVIQFAYTVKKHWNGILRWFKSRINNGILEGLNSVIQAAKAKARGFRTFKHFAYCIYLVAGRLEFDLPT
jgi:transposase